MAELVHQKDVTRHLIDINISSTRDFEWLYQLRFYFQPNEKDVLKCLTISMANAIFSYGWEYLGVSDFLVETPLIDQCYLTLTQVHTSTVN